MLTPLKSVHDRRFSWLRKVFLKSFQDWLNSVQQRQENFTKDAGQKIFVSLQAYEGLKINYYFKLLLNKLLKINLIQSLNLPNFFFDIRPNMH